MEDKTKREILALKRRRSELIKMLSYLSRGGWQNAKSYDYLPLEAELGRNENLK
jgi:hypothetical protein